MKLLLIVTMTFSIYACKSLKENRLVGTWKSHEEKTLKSMHANSNVTAYAKNIFKKNYFGRLTLVYKDKTCEVYFDGEKPKDKLNVYPYRIIKKTASFYIFGSGKKYTRKIYFEGNCYYTITTKWKFREYFCRVKK